MHVVHKRTWFSNIIYSAPPEYLSLLIVGHSSTKEFQLLPSSRLLIWYPPMISPTKTSLKAFQLSFVSFPIVLVPIAPMSVFWALFRLGLLCYGPKLPWCVPKLSWCVSELSCPFSGWHLVPKVSCYILKLSICFLVPWLLSHILNLGPFCGFAPSIDTT